MSSRPEGVTTSQDRSATPSQPKRTAVVAAGRRKIHTTFPDGTEMVEEYDLRTNDLLVRKRRGRSMLGAVQDWVYTCGQPTAPASLSTSNSVIRESSNSPVLVRKDTLSTIEFRIRNLPYPASVYDVSVDDGSQEIVIRTSNKKYFKRISVPEIAEVAVPLNARCLTWQYGNNTLLLVYRKPVALIEKEEKDRQEILNDQTIRQEGQNAPGECRQQ